MRSFTYLENCHKIGTSSADANGVIIKAEFLLLVLPCSGIS